MLDLVLIGVGIILAGFVIVFAGIASGSSRDQGERREVRGGGVVMIGPIPIIFGSDAKWASVAVALAIVLIVIVLLSGVLLGR